MSIRNLPQRLVQRFKLLAKVVPTLAKSPAISDPLPSAEMAKIRAEQARIKGLIDDAARDGLVPDAHVLSLHGCHAAELAEMRRQLGEEEAAYQAIWMRLDAMFPEPPAPLPEPPAPKPAQRFPLVGDLLSERGQPNPLH
jgi:hypothetical protein